MIDRRIIIPMMTHTKVRWLLPTGPSGALKYKKNNPTAIISPMTGANVFNTSMMFDLNVVRYIFKAFPHPQKNKTSSRWDQQLYDPAT